MRLQQPVKKPRERFGQNREDSLLRVLHPLLAPRGSSLHSAKEEQKRNYRQLQSRGTDLGVRATNRLKDLHCRHDV